MKEIDLKSLIREIPDFPKKGISFKDITTLIKNGKAFRYSVKKMAELVRDRRIDVIVAPESRGFIFGAALAHELGAGFVPVRKPGRLPAKTMKITYQKEYGLDTIEMHEDGIVRRQRVLLVDDLLATGGTTKATADLVENAGGKVVGCLFLVELSYLKPRRLLREYDVFSLVTYDKE